MNKKVKKTDCPQCGESIVPCHGERGLYNIEGDHLRDEKVCVCPECDYEEATQEFYPTESE